MLQIEKPLSAQLKVELRNKLSGRVLQAAGASRETGITLAERVMWNSTVAYTYSDYSILNRCSVIDLAIPD